MKVPKGSLRNNLQRFRHLKNHIAASATTTEQDPPPASKVAHIDLARLQEVGMVTPLGGRGRVLDEYRLIKRPIVCNAVSGTESQEKRRNLVMVTSAQPGEGKTFTAICLAMSVVAEENARVLLVDLDIATQQLCKTLGIPSETGLINLLHGTSTALSEVLVQTDVPRLTVLPAGVDHPLAHELLASPKMRSLMDDLSNRYRGWARDFRYCAGAHQHRHQRARDKRRASYNGRGSQSDRSRFGRGGGFLGKWVRTNLFRAKSG